MSAGHPAGLQCDDATLAVGPVVPKRSVKPSRSRKGLNSFVDRPTRVKRAGQCQQLFKLLQFSSFSYKYWPLNIILSLPKITLKSLTLLIWFDLLSRKLQNKSLLDVL